MQVHLDELGSDWGLVLTMHVTGNDDDAVEQRQALRDAVAMLQHGLELLNPDGSSGKITIKE